MHVANGFLVTNLTIPWGSASVMATDQKILGKILDFTVMLTCPRYHVLSQCTVVAVEEEKGWHDG